MKIAMLGQKRLSREGGIEIVVKELSTRMIKKGYDITCYNRSGHHISDVEHNRTLTGNTYKGVKLKCVPAIGKMGLSAVTSSFFGALLSAIGRYDIVHIHAEGPAFFCWIPKLFRKRVIVTIHGLDWQREKWKGSFGSKYIRFGEKMAVKWADEIIVLSKNVQDYFQDNYERNTTFIPNGICKPTIIKPIEIQKKFSLEKDSYVLYLGRIVPEKGIQYLIEAWQEIKSDKKLIIAGEASHTDAYMMQLKTLAANDSRVLFVGFVQGEILKELYSNSYLYVLPSNLEGMPLGLLEAMSYGNCCLVSNIDECSSVVEDAGVLFEKGSVKDLREKLQKLLNNPSIVAKYKNMATEYVCKKYDWNKVVDETIQLYLKTYTKL